MTINIIIQQKCEQIKFTGTRKALRRPPADRDMGHSAVMRNPAAGPFRNRGIFGCCSLFSPLGVEIMRLMKFFIPSAPSRRIRSPCRPRGGGVRRFVFRAAPAAKETGGNSPRPLPALAPFQRSSLCTLHMSVSKIFQFPCNTRWLRFIEGIHRNVHINSGEM